MASQKRILAVLIGALALAAVQTVGAEEAGEQKKLVVGAGTDNLLAMQREGKSAGGAQPIMGEVADRSYQRYLKSYEKPMPEFNATFDSNSQSGTK